MIYCQGVVYCMQGSGNMLALAMKAKGAVKALLDNMYT